MAVEFEITSGGETGTLEGTAVNGCDTQRFIEDAFSKVGRTLELRGIKFTITRIIKFIF